MLSVESETIGNAVLLRLRHLVFHFVAVCLILNTSCFGLKTITSSGPIRDSQGRVVSNGYILLTLNREETISATGSKLERGTAVRVALDGDGLVIGLPEVFANDELDPEGSWYLARIYSANNFLVRGPEDWVLFGSSPIDVQEERNPTNRHVINGSPDFATAGWSDLLEANVGSMDMEAEYKRASGGASGSSGFASAIVFPVSSKTVGGYAVAGIAQNNSSISQVSGGYFQGRCAVADTQCWGSNPLVIDTKGVSPNQMTGEEIDVDIYGAPRHVHGLLIGGAGNGIMPSDSPAISVTSTRPGANGWHTGLAIANAVTQPFGTGITIGYPRTATGKVNYPFLSWFLHGNTYDGRVGVDDAWSFSQLLNENGKPTFDIFAISNSGSPTTNLGVAIPNKLIIASEPIGGRDSSVIQNNATGQNVTFNLPATAISGGTIAYIANGDKNNLLYNGIGLLRYASIPPQSCEEQTFSIAGALVENHGVMCSPRASLGSIDLYWSAWIKENDTVSVRVCNPSSKNVSPSSVVWGCTISQ